MYACCSKQGHGEVGHRARLELAVGAIVGTCSTCAATAGAWGTAILHPKGRSVAALTTSDRGVTTGANPTKVVCTARWAVASSRLKLACEGNKTGTWLPLWKQVGKAGGAPAGECTPPAGSLQSTPSSSDVFRPSLQVLQRGSGHRSGRDGAPQAGQHCPASLPGAAASLPHVAAQE